MKIIIFISLFFLTPHAAYAYIDPGAGSSLVEMIIALVVGGVFFIKLHYQKIKEAFRRKKNGKSQM